MRDSEGGRGGEEEERRRYRELLEELRTMIPGAQVLLAFLLTVPFAARFTELDQTGKTVFVVSLTCAAAATVLFLAPAAYHRLGDRSDRRARLRFGVRTAVAGLMLLGLAVAMATFVVVRFVFAGVLAASVAGALAALAVAMWIVAPISDRHRSHGESEVARR